MSHRPMTFALAAACGILAGDREAFGSAFRAAGLGELCHRPPARGRRRPRRRSTAPRTSRGKMPTNDWWSSARLDEVLRPALSASAGRRSRAGRPAGLLSGGPHHRQFRPASSARCRPSGGDLILGHSAQQEFPDARVDGFSDWFVTARFAAAGRAMRGVLRARLALRLRPLRGRHRAPDLPAAAAGLGGRREQPRPRASRSTASTTGCSAPAGRPGPAWDQRR